MSRLTPEDGMLEDLLHNFRLTLEPPPAVFTKQLPADLESNRDLISVVMDILLEAGLNFEEGLPREHVFFYQRALAIDFISVMKVERPDVIDSLLRDADEIDRPSLQKTPPSQSTTKTQFHHFIPRFILKTFADNFSLSNSEFTTDTSNPRLSWFKPGYPSKRRPKVQPTYEINVYQAKDLTTNLTNISRAYGADNMYRDVTEVDCMKFEKLLSKHESTAAMFIRQIWNEEKDLSLTRTQLADMKRFLMIMMYRNEHHRSNYLRQDFEVLFEMTIIRHMEHNNISNAQTIWFENLKWIIVASVDDIHKEFLKAIDARSMTEKPDSILSPYLGPVHAVEMETLGFLMTQTIVVIWQAETGSEFILSDAGVGAYEGSEGIMFHNFFVVSPRFAIVLVNRHYVTERYKKNPCWTSMFGDKLHAFPETVFKKGPPPKDSKFATHASADDILKFKRIVVPKEDVYKVNGILLNDPNPSLAYKSKVSMYKSLRYYDKVKKEFFRLGCHDHSILRRQLFSDLNRTHPQYRPID